MRSLTSKECLTVSESDGAAAVCALAHRVVVAISPSTPERWGIARSMKGTARQDSRAGGFEFLFLMGSRRRSPVTTTGGVPLVSTSLKAQRSALNRKINTYRRKCRARETPPRVGELADYLGMPRWKLSRTVRRVFGHTLQEHLLRARIRCAKWYLRHSKLSMNRVAYICGFGTRNTFFKEFRDRTSATPDRYRHRTK